MRKTIVGMSLGLLALGLAGCATTPAEPQKGNSVRVSDPYDAAYIGLVDQVAKKRGVRVIWVNAPRRGPGQARVSYPPLDVAGGDEGPAPGTR